MDKLKEKVSVLQSENSALLQELDQVSRAASVCIVTLSTWHSFMFVITSQLLLV